MFRQYDDFELVIQSRGETYVVQLLNSPAGQASGEFAPPFTQVELSNFYGRIGQMRRSTRRVDAPDLEAAKKFGDKLFRAVFAGELLGQLRTSVDRAHEHGHGLRLRLRLKGVPALAELPWEFLYDLEQDHFLATSTMTPVVRYLDLPQSVSPLRVRLPLRVLVVLAGPRNLQCLDAEGEWERLKVSLGGLESSGLLILERLPVATLDALRRRARGEPFHILHFIGHGGFDKVAGDGVLHFEDGKGMSDPIPGQLLGNILRDHDSLRLAVLNACEGARQSTEDPFSGVAQSLCQQRLPAIVAMQFEISDEAAKTFSEEFYGAVADGLPVDAAVAEARKALFSGRYGQEWATPVLYMRSPNGLLFEVQRRTKQAVEKHEAKVDEAAAPPTVPPPPPSQPAQPKGPTREELKAIEREQREAKQKEEEEARRRAEEARQQEAARLKAEKELREQEEARRKAEEKRLNEANQRAEEERRKRERARVEQEESERVAKMKAEPPPPPLPIPATLYTAAPAVPPKGSHRVRKIILMVVGGIVGVFVLFILWGMWLNSRQSQSSGVATEGATQGATEVKGTAQSHVEAGNRAYTARKYDDAIAEYQAAIQINPNYAEAHARLCRSIAVKGENSPGQKGDYDTAVAECQRAVALKPNYAEAHSSLCNAMYDKEDFNLHVKGDFDPAFRECQRAIALDPTDAEAYNNLCNVVGTRAEGPVPQPGDYNDALAACLNAIRLRPHYAEAHKNLADLYRDAGDAALDKSKNAEATANYNKAAVEYRSALTSRPEYAVAQNQLGAMLYKTGDYVGAETELTKAIGLDPSDYVAHFYLGYVYVKQKDYDQAIAEFQKVTELKPDLAQGEYGLWTALKEQGNLAYAKQHLIRAYALDENDKSIVADYKRYITNQSK